MAGEGRAPSKPWYATLTPEARELLMGPLDMRYAGGALAHVQTVAAAGPTVLIEPPAGERILLLWVQVIPNSDNAAANLVDLGFGDSGVITDRKYRSYVLAHWEPFLGAPDEAFIIEAATPEPVAVTVHYKVLP